MFAPCFSDGVAFVLLWKSRRVFVRLGGDLFIFGACLDGVSSTSLVSGVEVKASAKSKIFFTGVKKNLNFYFGRSLLSRNYCIFDRYGFLGN